MSDLIERDKAKIAVRLGMLSAATIYGRTDEGMTARKEIERAIDELPSAKPEIIRCRDCVHYEISRLKKDGTDDKRYKRTACVNGANARYRPPDWYCADAERREK